MPFDKQEKHQTHSSVSQQASEVQPHKTASNAWSAAIQRARLNPASLIPADVLHLQRTIGNQAVGRLLSAKARTDRVVQRKGDSSDRTGLPDNLKSGIETLSGMSMDDVRIHYNSSKPAELQALAYTQGTEIHVAPGQERHLPHEAWHVVQQKQGRVQPTLHITPTQINEDQPLEKEADEMGRKAAQSGT